MTQFHLFIHSWTAFDPGARGDWILVPFTMSVSMNPKQMELISKQTSTIQTLTLSDMEEGMGQNIAKAQGLQQGLAQRRASLSQELAKAQALQGKEALLADLVEEEMAHQIQVLFLSHLHLRQDKEIKAQSKEIKQFSTLVERHKPSWNMSRNSRVVSFRYLTLSHLDPSWMSYIKMYLTFSQTQWMPDVVLALSTCLDCLKLFWSWERPFLKVNWLRKPCGAHIIPAMCALPIVRRGSNINTPKTSIQNKGE